MCIIFYNEHGHEYNPEEIRNAWRTNHDGVGIMWCENGKVRTIRGLLNLEDTVKLAAEFTGIPNVLHLRYGTHGGVKEHLVHPFLASPEGAQEAVYLAHNGIMSAKEAGGDCGPDDSDTTVFARSMQAEAAQYGTDIFFDDTWLRQLETRIDKYNKVIFLSDSGKVGIVHPESWYPDEETGIWYSNQYSIRPSYERYTGHAHSWSSSYGSSRSYSRSSSDNYAKNWNHIFASRLTDLVDEECFDVDEDSDGGMSMEDAGRQIELELDLNDLGVDEIENIELLPYTEDDDDDDGIMLSGAWD